MTTNKPRVVCHEVKAVGAPVTLKFIVREDVADEYMDTLSERHPVVSSSPLIRLIDYEALQAECNALRAKTSTSLGVGDGTGNLFVHGDYESIKRVQELIFECEKLRKDAERYRWLRDPCSGAERVAMYCRGDCGRGLMRYTMLDGAIDAAMEAQK